MRAIGAPSNQASGGFISDDQNVYASYLGPPLTESVDVNQPVAVVARAEVGVLDAVLGPLTTGFNISISSGSTSVSESVTLTADPTTQPIAATVLPSTFSFSAPGTYTVNGSWGTANVPFEAQVNFLTVNVATPANLLTDQELNALNTVLSEGQASASGWANAIATFKSTGNAIASFASFLATEAELGLGAAISRVAGVFVSGATVALDPSVAKGIQAVAQAARDPTNPGITNPLERNQLNQFFQQEAATFQVPPPPPVGPTSTVGNTQKFQIPVTAGQPVTIDPAFATGFEYETGAGDPNFASVILPFLGSFQPYYDIQVFNNGAWVDDGLAYPLQEFVFNEPGGVTDFRVLGISEAAALSLPLDFVSALTFEDTGVFTGTVTELTNVPEPPSLALLGAGIACLLLSWRHRNRPNAKVAEV